MKLSTKGRYAARLMLDLALRYGQGSILLKDVSQREEISEKYLGHLISALKTAGLVNSRRGAHGGYTLARAPEDITLAEIVLAVEGNLNVAECVSAPKVCHRVESCVPRDIWSQLSEKMMEVLQGTTLENMVCQSREKQKVRSLMYSI